HPCSSVVPFRLSFYNNIPLTSQEVQMKLAFSTNAFSRHPLPHALHEIARVGYTAVEILIDKPHLYPDHFDPAEAHALPTLLNTPNRHATCTFGSCKDPPPDPFFDPSLISPTPKLRADRSAMIQNTLQYAHALGADNISITSGKSLPTMPPQKAMQQLKDSL